MLTTAYGSRISAWSSYVCSPDLVTRDVVYYAGAHPPRRVVAEEPAVPAAHVDHRAGAVDHQHEGPEGCEDLVGFHGLRSGRRQRPASVPPPRRGPSVGDERSRRHPVRRAGRWAGETWRLTREAAARRRRAPVCSSPTRPNGPWPRPCAG